MKKIQKIQTVESKKLQLNHESIRELQRAQLAIAVGGHKENATVKGC